MSSHEERFAASVADYPFRLQIRTQDDRLLSEWLIPNGDDVPDVEAEIGWLRSSYHVDPQGVSNADAILRGDS